MIIPADRKEITQFAHLAPQEPGPRIVFAVGIDLQYRPFSVHYSRRDTRGTGGRYSHEHEEKSRSFSPDVKPVPTAFEYASFIVHSS